MRGRTEPTKSNLIRIKREASLAKTGLEILDRKREILLRELTVIMSDYEIRYMKIAALLKPLYSKTRSALSAVGPRAAAYETIPVPGQIVIRADEKRIMGVKIPSLNLDQSKKVPHALSPEIDTLSGEIIHAIPELLAYAESVCAMRRIARELSKTRKREKAIEEIHLPSYTREINRITESLDENEREELSRYKALKRRLYD
jgi:V/A-type H+-transporting ATPase subunit D